MFPPSCPLSSTSLPLYPTRLSSRSVSNSLLRSDIFLLALLSTIHAPSLCTPPPIHLRSIGGLSGYFVEVNAVARGPAGGRCSLGDRVSLRGSQVRSDGCSWHRPQGMCVCERSLCYWASFCPRLPFCHFSVTLFLPAYFNKKPRLHRAMLSLSNELLHTDI